MVSIVAVALLGAIAGCGASSPRTTSPGSDDPSWNGVLERAAAQGSVNIYSVAPPAQMDRVVDAFETAYPDISVNATRGAGELIPRVTAEVQNRTDGADVFIFSDPAWFADNASALLPVDSPSASQWPAEGWTVPGSAAVTTVAPFGMIVWNTRTFPDGFRNYQDLLRPNVAGLFGTRSDLTPTVAGYLDFLETSQGDTYLETLWARGPKFYPSAVPLAQAVASGEIGVANISVPSIVKDLQEKGAPIEAIVPNPGFSTNFVGAALRKTSRPDAARVFMDFLLSVEGQRAMNGEGYGGSVIPIDGSIDVAGQTILDSTKYTSEVINNWQRRFDSAFVR